MIVIGQAPQLPRELGIATDRASRVQEGEYPGLDIRLCRARDIRPLERHRLGKVAAWSGGHAWRQNSLSRPCLAESNAGREPRHDDDRRDLHDALQRDGEKITVRQLADPGAVR